MTIKILQAAPTASFGGIEYNEKKTPDGRSELLVAKNFGLLEMQESATKADYIFYMQKVAETNPRVKNTQFHAVLSCKGREATPEQLKEIAVQYLERMGYSKNPYLIYYHSDTANNHVHMVSTRVDKFGVKVPDSMERVRSQDAIRQILAINPINAFNADIAKAFEYNVTSDAQLRLVLEKMGYSVTPGDKSVKLFKYGKLQGEYNIADVQNRIASSKIDDSRIDQIKALVHKYKGVKDAGLIWQGLPLPGGLASKTEGKLSSPLSDFLHKSFGIEMVFHNKGGKSPYGYTIIDHSYKQVLKGSQVMSLVDLLSPVLNENRQSGIETIVLNAVATQKGYNQLKEYLKENSLFMNWRGAVRVKGTSNEVYQIAPEDLKRLKYNDRLTNASKFELSTHKEKYIIASQFFVKMSDLDIAGKGTENFNHINDKFKSILHNSGNLSEALKEAGLKLVVMGNDTYIIDIEHSIIQNIADTLSVEERHLISEGLHLLAPEHIEDGKDLDKEAEQYEGPEPFNVAGRGEVSPIDHGVSLQDIQQIFGEIKDEKDPAASKKRKRKRS